MFGVNDLLVSQGYQVSKDPTTSFEDPRGGDQNEDTGRKSGQASGNGLPIHPGAIPKTNRGRRNQNDDKSNLVIRGRQWNAHYEDFSSPCNVQEGLYDQSELSSSSLSKKDKEFIYWKRQCQDFNAYDYPNRVDPETRGMAKPYELFEAENESQWEIEEGLENKQNKQETMKSPGDYRRRSLKREIWQQSTAFGWHENKSQSCPRFFSPENSNSGEIPTIVSSKQHKVKPELESLKHSEPATRPKYGRPLKPPPYEFHQQSRGLVESNPPQKEQKTHKTTFYVTKVDESGQDSTLEPPGYIPPPSYKSPSQPSKNQHVLKEVSSYDKSFIKEMQLLEQSICISSDSSVNQLQMEEEEQILCSNKAQMKCQETHQSSVQYIPFDDPRIRHIKVTHPADHQVEAEDKKSSIFYKNSVDQEFNNSHVNVPDSINIAVKHSQVSGSNRGLVESNADQDSCALSTQGGSSDTGNSVICEPKARPSAPSPGATGISSEILKKVKTFEPGTEIQGKNHLKKKTNETMFCLVSVPLQSELHMPGSSSELKGFDRNRGLKDQNFLSMSSTDLELQALTGNMINILEKQDFQRPGLKQMNDLSGKQPPKHKELEYSGSWPIIKYKDQQTQTNFSEEPPIRQPLHELQLRKSNTLTNGRFLKYVPSTTESAPKSLPTDNRKDRPIIPPRKAQLNKPSKPEGPKTVINPRTGQNDLGTSSAGLPGRKNESRFAHKEESKSPCNIKEPFGQFLLKPVSRRPWDAISELESFNNEIQKQEEKSEDAKKNEQNQEREKGKKEEGKAGRADEASQDYGCSTQMRKVKPVFKKETDKTKPECENASNISAARKFSNLRYSKSETKEMDKPVKEKKESVDLKERQEKARKIIKQAIDLHPMKAQVSARSKSGNSFLPRSTINSKEASVENHKNKDSDKLKKAAGRNIPTSEIASVAPFSFKRKSQGRSEPNLRSVGLDVNNGTTITDSSTKKIPPNETLQTRAARILGIEVAVESLTADNKALPDEDCDSDNMAQGREFSEKKMTRSEIKKDVAFSKGMPKSSLPKSSFIGEDISGSVKEQRNGKIKLTREQSFRRRSDQPLAYISKHQEDNACSPESAMLPERKSLPSNVGKNPRSPSKIIVPKQGKVASAVSRAAMDRIARMKEIDSISRMRRLSIKNGEDRGEGHKKAKEPEGKGNDSTSGRTEFPRKLSQGSCVSKRIISLNENDQLVNTNAKKSGRDLLSSEVYDPSRVERV